MYRPILHGTEVKFLVRLVVHRADFTPKHIRPSQCRFIGRLLNTFHRRWLFIVNAPLLGGWISIRSVLPRTRQIDCVGMHAIDSSTNFRPSPSGSYSGIFANYPSESVHLEAQHEPLIPIDDGSTLINNFFDKQIIILPIVSKNLFLQHRRFYYSNSIVHFAFSLSLEYAIYAAVTDVENPRQADILASKAKKLLDTEMSMGLMTLGSMQAGLLLGWRESGSGISGHYCTLSAGLNKYFLTNTDPDNLGIFSPEQAHTRRLIHWNSFVFDR